MTRLEEVAIRLYTTKMGLLTMEEAVIAAERFLMVIDAHERGKELRIRLAYRRQYLARTGEETTDGNEDTVSNSDTPQS